jgi:ribosomal protein S18 acetylase RimI-like enzyme
MADAPGAAGSVSGADIRVRPFGPADADALTMFFGEVAADPTADRFHPHAFTAQAARTIAEHQGRDLYLGQFLGDKLVGYGMLRGWDAGYDIPSLGIYLSPGARGLGLARTLMEDLHHWARKSGAQKVRLKVYRDNVRAMTLYERLGYVFFAEEGEQRVGLFELVSQGDGR